MTNITKREDLGEFCIVTLRGEIDAYTAPSLRVELEQLIGTSAPITAFVIDLADVTFLDSSALGALVGAMRLLRKRGSELRVVEPRTAVSRIFAQTRLDTVLALYPSRELALTAASA